jgi:hypothetical protein
MVAMETAKRTANLRYPLSTERLVAVSLLLVLFTGLSITTFTEGWIANLPYHDHLILGARALGVVHHAHHGDPLDHAQRAIQSVQATATVGQPQEDGILSLRPLSAQPELNSATAQGWGGDFSLPLPPEAAALLLLAALLLAAGRSYAPPSPPPRFA